MGDMPADAPTIETLLAHQGSVRALAHSLVRDVHRADDLVQDTWVRALERPPTRRETARGWLAAVARNLARDSRRGNARRLARERAAHVVAAVPEPDALVARAETHRRLIELVVALEEPYRSTILLRFFEGLEPREIARRTGTPDATVRTRLHRALALLRGRLGADGEAAVLAAAVPLATGTLARGAARKLLGGLVVTTKQKVAVALVLLAFAAGGAGVLATRSAHQDAAATPGTPTETADAATPDLRTERTRVGAQAAPEPSAPADAPAAESVPAADPAPQQQPPAPTEPAAPGRLRLVAHVVGYVEPESPPPGYTELLPGEEPVIDDPGTALGGASGPRALPYWSRWARVPETGTVTLRGRVTDASGRALADAEVYRVKLDAEGRRASPSSYQWVKEIARTDADGRFEAREQPAGAYLVAADHGAAMRRPRGLDLEGSLAVNVTDGDTRTDLDIRLPFESARRVTVRGVVRDENGAPFRSAQVTGPLQREWTDAAGRFELRGLEPGAVVLTIGGTGHETQRITIDAQPGATEELDVTLALAEQGGLTLEGRVVDESGAGVADAPVFLGAGRLGSRWARSGADGVFRFVGLPETYAKTPVRVMVSPVPERDFFLPLGKPLDVTVPSPGLELRVRRTALLHVLLRDAETGAPLPLYKIDATVEEIADGESRWRQIHSMSVYDPDGTAEMAVPRGRVRLVVRAKDHRGVEVLVDVPDDVQEKEVEIRLD